MTLKRWLVSLTLLLLLISSTFAQDSTQPLIIVKAGDLWEWTGGTALRQKTQWGYNSDIQISPLMNEVAYSSLPPVVVDVIDRGGGFEGAPLPNNLWLISTDTSDAAVRIADQPTDASFMTLGIPDNVITRSSPAWSPDGSEIAWTEPIDAMGLIYRVVIYDKVSQTTRTLPTELGTEAKSLPAIWTTNGLVLTTYSLNNSTITFEPTYVVLDTTTGARKSMIMPMPIITKPNGMLRPKNAIPVLYEGAIWMATLYKGDQSVPSQWLLYNLETGEERDAPNPPQAQRFLEGAEGMVTVKADILDNKVLSYNAFAPDGSWIQLTNNPRKYVSNFALSPDGQAIAYQLEMRGTVERDRTIYVWRNGVIGTVPQTEDAQEFEWAQATWIIP